MAVPCPPWRVSPGRGLRRAALPCCYVTLLCHAVDVVEIAVMVCCLYYVVRAMLLCYAVILMLCCSAMLFFLAVMHCCYCYPMPLLLCLLLCFSTVSHSTTQHRDKNHNSSIA